MVLTLILKFIASLLAMFLSILPTVGVADIPFIGAYIAQYLSLAVSYINTATVILPFMAVVWHTFIWVILPFEFGMLLAKVFFGSRLPANMD